MNYELALLIAVFVEGLLLLKGLMELSRQIEEGLDELDQTLAEAIANVIQGVGMAEPVSPIQNALAQVLLNSVNPESSSRPVEILQGADGRFIPKE